MSKKGPSRTYKVQKKQILTTKVYRVRRVAPKVYTKASFTSSLHNPVKPVFRPKLARRMVYNPPKGKTKPDVKRRILASLAATGADVKRLKTCLSRSARREVLHAFGVAGSKVSKPTYTQKSKVRC